MPEEIHEFSASGRQKKDSEELIYLWVAEAWHDIPQDMILRSLLKCSISNSLDGTKNDLVQCIWEFSREFCWWTWLFIYSRIVYVWWWGVRLQRILTLDERIKRVIKSFEWVGVSSERRKWPSRLNEWIFLKNGWRMPFEWVQSFSNSLQLDVSGTPFKNRKLLVYVFPCRVTFIQFVFDYFI